ncbi:MAG: nucleotidyl transferase AbiEii/AbiGii toxin family protein [bacterium]
MIILYQLFQLVNKFDRFALKGGTAINLFFRNMPRLSVDIDLVYLPIEDRPSTFGQYYNKIDNIDKEMH